VRIGTLTAGPDSGTLTSSSTSGLLNSQAAAPLHGVYPYVYVLQRGKCRALLSPGRLVG